MSTKVIELSIPVQERLERLHGELIEFAENPMASRHGVIFWQRINALGEQEYITHVMNVDSGEFFGGNYFHGDRTSAKADFDRRANIWA